MKSKGIMNRRKFLKLSATGAAAGTTALITNSGMLFTREDNSETIAHDVKEIFYESGTCSRTFIHLLNREFGYQKETEELASDPLAGGLMGKQHQCGMLWGSSLAVGAESLRRYTNRDQALAKTISATQHIMESFSKRAKSVNCGNIVVDLNNNFDIVKFILKSLPGGFTNILCMNLAEKWAPEAIRTARVQLSGKSADLPQIPISCASEVAGRMGASDEEMVMVAGFAGGMGLSGNACGALAAAIWINSLAWCKENPGKSGNANPHADEILKAFYAATDSGILCHKISGKRFNTIGDHTEFIRNGGCDNLINILARS